MHGSLSSHFSYQLAHTTLQARIQETPILHNNGPQSAEVVILVDHTRQRKSLQYLL
jgi:hypothetical protein